MKNSKKKLSSVGQSKTEKKRSYKQDTDLHKDSSLYFQIGLILCLLLTYGLFEMQFQKRNINIINQDYGEESSIDIAETYQLEPKPTAESKPKVIKPQQLIDIYEPVDNSTQKIETNIVSSEEQTIDEAYDPKDISGIEETPDEPGDVFIAAVQVVPVFPGCEKYLTNEKRKKCMSQKIGKLISKKFNTSVGLEYGLQGTQKIYTQFTIDKYGQVSNIKVRGPHPALEKEAHRVINKIPKMEPGLQGAKPVGVIYTLPITFAAEQ